MNLRYQLRAYEDIAPVRVAAIIVHLGRAGHATLTRDQVVAEWSRRYPGHVDLTGRRGVRSKVGKGLSTLKVVRAVDVHDRWIVPGPDVGALRMAADNLAVLETAGRHAVPRTAWTRLPRVPAHLEEIQRRVAPKAVAGPVPVGLARP